MGNRFLKALVWAADLHRLQRRKGPAEPVPGKCPRAIPYINHPIAVASLLAEVGGVKDEDVLIAGLLHDVIEDTVATSEDVLERFGSRIHGIVMEVTDDRSLSQEKRKALQIEKAGALSREAKLVKLADKIHNCQDLWDSPPVGWSEQRIAEYREWSRKVVAPIRGVSPELEAEFDRVLQSR